MTDKNILDALYRKAIGGSIKEVTEEYGGEDGENLLKRKVTDKYVPPDVSALKTYIELAGEDDILTMSDEEKKKKKERLLKELKESEKS